MKLLVFILLLLSLQAQAQKSERFYKTKDSLNYLYMQQQFKKDSLNNQIIKNLDYYNKERARQLKRQKTKLTVYTVTFTLLIIIISLTQ